MAFLKEAITAEEVKKKPIADLRSYCVKIFDNYNKFINNDLIVCPYCGKPKSKVNAYYIDDRFAIGVYPQCKDCVRLEVEQRKSNKIEPNETEESVQQMLKKMDLPYIDDLYKRAVKQIKDDTGERHISSPFLSYLRQVKTLPQYDKKHWIDSDFGMIEDYEEEFIKDTRKNQKIIKYGKQRFGLNYSNQDLFWLENEYQDWISRYPCESKAQETLFRTLCCQELEREELRIHKKGTKDIDKSIQDTMNALGIKPSQSNAEAMADQMSFGQLLDKWEHDKPIPKPEKEFEDPDKIGLLIDVFFKGHLSKMMSLKNAFSTLYEKYMSKYTVTKPEVSEEDEEALFNQIFGEQLDGD